MVRGGCDAALTDLLLWERLLRRVHALLCYGLCFQEEPKGILKLIFREGFLCFEKIVGMKLFAKIRYRRIRFERRFPKRQYKKEDQ